ncbi:MAG: hypothetical protein MMC23_006419 [Stictis urceolatum]|nr:hypothetical protein [Stictis urceolata]
MLPLRAIISPLLGLCVFLGCVNAQQSSSHIPTKTRKTPAPDTSTSTHARVFSTTLQTFPTDVQTKTISSWSLNPTETGVFEYYPVFQNQTSESLSFSISLDPGTGLTAWCWYPVSGQYGLLPRLLFYITILAALVLRHHQWLYAGALVSALTYSGTAAIHACLLIWRGPAAGDLDLIALVAILSLSCVVTVPLLNWSSTLRNIGKNENEIKRSTSLEEKRDDEFDAVSRAIVLYWGFLVTAGFLCVFIALQNYVWYQNPKWWEMIIPGGPNDIRCSPEGGRLDTTAGQSPIFANFVVDAEFASINRCTNPCDFASREAIFRTPGDLQLIDEDRLVRFLGEGSKRQKRNDAFSGIYISVGLLSLPYILLQGFWAALFGRRTPAQARNVIYALLTRLRLSKRRSQLDPAGPFQKGFAKFCAMLSYLWAVFVLVICVPIIIINILAIEIFLHILPEGEQPTHIGAWEPWAGTGIALVAALFARYNEDIKYGFFMTVYKSAWMAAHPSWPFLMLSNRLRGDVAAKSIFTGNMETMPDRDFYRKATKRVVGGTYGKSNNYVTDKILWFFRAIRGEWRQIGEFWRDPEYSRANQGRVHRLELNDCKCLMKCGCLVEPDCRHDEICKPQHVCKHDPKCKHTRACRREKRIRLLNPERVGVNMAISHIHGHRFKLDVTGKPIPLRDMGRSLNEPTMLYPMGSTDYASIRSDADSDEDEKFNAVVSTRSSKQRIPARLSKLFGFGRKSMTDQKPSTRGLVAQILQPRGASFDNGPLTKHKSTSVVVSEDPVHPALRSTYHDAYHMRQSSSEMHQGRPSIYSINEADLLQRRQSARKNLPPTPGSGPPRVPYTTPDENSPASPGEHSLPVSPVRTKESRPAPGSQLSVSEGPSPDSQPESNPSSTELVSPQSQTNPSPPRPALQQRYSNPPPTHIVTQLRSSAGLTSSFEQAIMSRQRRSAAYSPIDPPSNPSNRTSATPSTNQLLSPPKHSTRAKLTNSSNDPIPVHTEPPTPLVEVPGDDSYFAHGQTPSDLAASMPFSPTEDHPHSHSRSHSSSLSLSPESSNLLPPSLPPTPPPKNTPPPTSSPSLPSSPSAPHPGLKHRHTLPPILQAPTYPTLPMPRNLNLDLIDLSAPKTSKTAALNQMAEDSKASTPAILLPALSPPHPSSNTALAQRGEWSGMRSPHMVTPAAGVTGAGQGQGQGQRGGSARAPLSLAGSRIQSLEGVREEGVGQGRSLERGGEEGMGSIDEGRSMVGPGMGLERRGSPRPSGYRSTVSYLQVQRPETVLFKDEITLRKDEFGVYRLVVNGEDVVE